MGRRKIKIERITNKHDRFICFSKRRKGLFNKANELAVRGFQIAILVFSRSGNAFVYGSPSVEKVIERFLHNSGSTNGAGSSNAAENITKALEEDRKETNTKERAKEKDSLDSALMESEQFWWNSSVENLSWENLLQFKSALEGLLSNVRRKADSLLVEHDFLAGFT